MNAKKMINKRRQRKTERVRYRLSQRRGGVPRISVFRSAKHIYAQLIDDIQQNTLASCSSLEMKDLQGSKKEVAHLVGKELARKAKAKGLGKVVFDRGWYLYHGRIKALAEGLREGGIHL